MAVFRLLLASNNAHKATEFRRLFEGLDLELVTPREVGLELDVAETGETFKENARLKARAFAAASGLASLADDSGIEVDALDGRPGVFSARYGGDGLDDEGRVRLLLHELDGVAGPRRGCRYRVALVLVDPAGGEWITEGRCEGWVGLAPSGSNGFGYDPVFYVPTFGKTIAELGPTQKDTISHRGKAARAMADVLAWRMG